MYINYYESYLSMIRNSVGSHTWKNLFVYKENGHNIDILQDGNVSCAYYVSSILKQFGYCWASYANVLSLEKHLIEYGRSEQKYFTEDAITPWSVIIREEKKWSEKKDIYGNSIKGHYHVGFYIWSWMAISNMSDGFAIDDVNARTPQEHHITYNWSRPIRSILKRDFTMDILQHFQQKNYTSHINKQLEIPFLGQTKKWLVQPHHQLSQQEIERASGEKEGMKYGKLCWLSCIIMAHNFLLPKSSPKSYYEGLQYKHKKIGFFHTIRSDKMWRNHTWLEYICKERWLKTTYYKHCTITQFKELLADAIANKKVIICSVWYDDFAWVHKSWHLVVISWYNRNGYKEELIINDPHDILDNEWKSWTPIWIDVSIFMKSFSWNLIIVSTT